MADGNKLIDRRSLAFLRGVALVLFLVKQRERRTIMHHEALRQVDEDGLLGLVLGP